MRDPSDFVFEVRARSYAAVPVLLFAGGAALAAGLTLAVPALQERWWVITLAVAVLTILLIISAWFGPVVARGGVYRVAVHGGRLRVKSPSRRVFGPAFEVELEAIERLVVRSNGDWPDEYEVHTPGGVFRIDSVCGGDLFAAIRRLRPGVPCDRA